MRRARPALSFGSYNPIATRPNPERPQVMKYRRQPFGCKPLHIGTFARRDDPKEKLGRILMIDNLAAHIGYVELRFSNAERFSIFARMCTSFFDRTTGSAGKQRTVLFLLVQFCTQRD